MVVSSDLPWEDPGLSTTSSSASASSVAGSGIDPSITHRLDSYFVRMKFSIFLEAFQQSVYPRVIADLPVRRYVTGCQFSLPVPVHVRILTMTFNSYIRRTCSPLSFPTVVRSVAARPSRHPGPRTLPD